MNGVFFNLSCSFDASSFRDTNAVCSGEKRILQYVEGFKSFFNFYRKYLNSYESVYVVDNTLKDISHLDERIINEIPEAVQYVFTQKNNYGKINKGAGVLENWHALKETIFQYEFMFHYEPRLLIKTPEIFNRFIKERKTTFLEHEIEQFKTGALIIKTSDFKKYLQSRNAEMLRRLNTSIEDDIYNFFKNDKHDFTLIKNSGILRYDSAINSWSEY